MSVVKLHLHMRDQFVVTDGKVMYEGYVPKEFTSKGSEGGDGVTIEIDTDSMTIRNFKLPSNFEVRNLFRCGKDNQIGYFFDEKTNKQLKTKNQLNEVYREEI